ncbi:MAG: TIM barrel protein [Desulfitobacteriaceae bacterium]|nr:TIM barrel protein [Desulfitobacteriaceae bacterium]MDI6914037.1 TIM barrel protein [Desulfitobacteriaceae bacterium]
MNREQIVVNTIVFLNELAGGKPQVELLEGIHLLGLTKVEIRREYLRVFPDDLLQIKRAAQVHQVEVFYSVPDGLFKQGELQGRALEQYLAEADRLGAKLVKFSVGEFNGFSVESLTKLKQILAEFAGIVTVENDQTKQSGTMKTNREFLRVCQENDLRIYGTFDVGNWYWVGEDPLTNAVELKDYICYIHLKDAVCENSGVRAASLDQGSIAWRQVLQGLPSGLPVAIEYPCGDRPLEVLGEELSKLLEL